MIKNISIKYIGNKTQVQTGRRDKGYTVRTYELHRLTDASAKRLSNVLANNYINKTVHLDEADLTPTVYFSYGQAKIEQIKVGKSLLYPETNKIKEDVSAVRSAIWGGNCD